MSTAAIRKELRNRRRALSPRQQQQAAESLLKLVARQPFFLRAERLAFYLANDGEIDPAPLLKLAQAAGKQVYLPVLHPLQFNRLYFARYDNHSSLRSNRFGIPEPDLRTAQCAAPWTLDCIFLPLVGFDQYGSRIGMGGGFYDRTLAFTRKNTAKTRLIGLAHSCQQVDKIARADWDIPLDLIATETQLLCAKQK